MLLRHGGEAWVGSPQLQSPHMGTIVATFTADSIQSKVPEPVTMALLGSALIGLGLFGRKRFTR